MFRFRSWMMGLCVLVTAITPAAAADLSKIDRTIRKEPEYKDKPKYTLLVFGPEAKTRVWVVQDGETLYVDRNGDGDLTGKDERFTLASLNGNRNSYGSLKDCNIEIRDPDKQTRYLITSISIFPEDHNKPTEKPHLMVNVDIKGRLAYRQYCDAKLGDKPDNAAIAHFHGPLTIEPRKINWKLMPELSRLPLGDPAGDIYAVVGTMDAERGCWVVVRSEDLPKDLHPTVEVEYPARKSEDASIKKRYRLEQRC
jgi:hypothetical protein